MYLLMGGLCSSNIQLDLRSMVEYWYETNLECDNNGRLLHPRSTSIWSCYGLTPNTKFITHKKWRHVGDSFLIGSNIVPIRQNNGIIMLFSKERRC